MIELNITSPSGETRSVNAQNVDSVSRVCQKAVSEFSLTEVNYQLQVKALPHTLFVDYLPSFWYLRDSGDSSVVER